MSFKVLFLEDIDIDKDRVLVALAQEKIFYNYTDNWEEARNHLSSDQYDLVIADLIIYESRVEADLGATSRKPGQFKCLPHLLEITESTDPPIPVVVYTGQSTIKTIRPFLDRIVDFWDKKQVVDPDFIAFRIRKIRDLIEFERPTSPLIKSLKQATSENPETPWRDDINQILQDYESYVSSLDQGLIVQSPLARIASSLGLSTNFKAGFEVALRSDSPISITLGSRPHFHHSINCFLLGYYLLNQAQIDWIQIFKSDKASFFNKRLNSEYSHLEPEAAEKKVWQEINNSWFAASLLHDCTSVIQRFPKLREQFTQLAEKLNLCSKLQPSEKFSIIEELSSKATARYTSTDSKLADYIANIQDKTDHGFASAVFILTHCFDEVNRNKKDAEFLKPAAEAVFLHNFVTKSDFPAIYFNKSPIAGLLILCDAIQSWKRDLPENELETEDIITKAELTELSSKSGADGGPDITIKVRYLPPAFIAKHKQTIDRNELLLLDVLQKYVKDPIRQKVTFDFQGSPVNLNIKFYVGHKRIEELDIPEKD